MQLLDMYLEWQWLIQISNVSLGNQVLINYVKKHESKYNTHDSLKEA